MSPVRYELGVCVPENDILHSHRCENLKPYIALNGCSLQRKRKVSPVRYQLGFCIPEDDILHSHHRDNLKSYKEALVDCVRCLTETSCLGRIFINVLQ
jgi:hypothetical protein